MEPTLGIDVAEQRRRLGAVGAALRRAHRLGGRDVEQSLAQVVAGQAERIVTPAFAARAGGRPQRPSTCGGGRRQFLEDIVEQALVEIEVGAQRFRRDVRGDLWHHADRRLFELEVDGQDELLSDVVRIELEGALGGSQGPVEVAEVREGKAQVVVSPGVVRVGLDCADERVARVREALELDQHDPDAVPRGRGVGLVRENLAVGFERQLKAAQVEEEQREVEPRGDEFRAQTQRRAKPLDCLVGGALLGQHHADVVPGERVLGIDLDRPAVGVERVGRASYLVQHDAAFVPQLRRVGVFAQQTLVQLEGRREVAPQ